jgi:hypothetical protein
MPLTTQNVDVTFRPLTQWPAGRAKTPDGEREHAKFKAPGRYENSGTPAQRYVGPKAMPVERTYEDLDRELWQIGAEDVVVQVDMPANSFLKDGSGPRSDRLAYSPAVVLTFKRDGRQHTFACDRFERWQDNLRGIALGLEGLRRLERYGIVQAGEQYRGWQALPASTTPALSTVQAAKAIDRLSYNLGNWAAILAHAHHARDAIRAARSKTHPDAGGTSADFTLVQEAARVLGAHHGVSL